MNIKNYSISVYRGFQPIAIWLEMRWVAQPAKQQLLLWQREAKGQDCCLLPISGESTQSWYIVYIAKRKYVINRRSSNNFPIWRRSLGVTSHTPGITWAYAITAENWHGIHWYPMTRQAFLQTDKEILALSERKKRLGLVGWRSSPSPMAWFLGLPLF